MKQHPGSEPLELEAHNDLIDTLESVSDSFFSVDRNWKVTRLNSHHERTSAIKREDQIGKSLLDLFFSDPVYKDSKYLKAYNKAMSERVEVQFEDFYEPLQLWTEVRVYPKSDGGLAVFFTDISERKRTEAIRKLERHKFETLFAVSPAAMVLWRGEDMVYEMVNSQYQNMFEGHQFIGRKLLDVFPELIQSEYPEILANVFKTGEPYFSREKLARVARFPGGPLEDRYFDNSFVQMRSPDGTPYGIYNHAIDVNDRVFARKELEAAKLEAERANQTKSAFLANMSHEIRTPLGAILGFSDLLRDKNLSIEEREQFLETISRNGKALTRIIDDILDLAKVESGKMDLEKVEFSLIDLIEEVIDLFKEQTNARGIYLRVSMTEAIPKRILSDPQRLRQILINIVCNAVKFTHKGGVQIQLSVELRDNKHYDFRISITDTGISIPIEKRQRLFQPFSQADNSTSRRYGGTGLGLVLSERFARALGGGVAIKNCEEGVGCTFEVTFVADVPKGLETHRRAVLKSSATAPQQKLPLSDINILLADDSLDNQLLVSRILAKNGASVTTVSNGLQAFQSALAGEYDLVLMDIQMPEMDGYEATRSLRRSGFKKPIIALTAHAMAEDKARTRAAGCDEHLTKPSNPPALVAAICAQIARQIS